jgi:hypothetical protein
MLLCNLLPVSTKLSECLYTVSNFFFQYFFLDFLVHGSCANFVRFLSTLYFNALINGIFNLLIFDHLLPVCRNIIHGRAQQLRPVIPAFQESKIIKYHG